MDDFIQDILDEPGSLEAVREAIGNVDTALVDLLNRRANLSLAAGRLKREGLIKGEIFQPGRELELIKSLEHQSAGPLPIEHLRAIYREILSSSRYLQRPQRVAFPGPEGSFSHMAARALLGSLASFHSQADMEGVFLAVANGDCDTGIVPLEQSRQDGLGAVIDLFIRHELFIQAETFFQMRHSLLAREKDLASIGRVCTHPLPLAQCSQWLMKHLPRASFLPMESAAAAAKHVAESKKKGLAAIAHSSLAGELNLHLLAAGIENDSGSRTRFVLVGRKEADRPGTDKSSLLFSVSDKKGSLARVLQCLGDRKISLHKIESRPLPDDADKHVFFVDLDCDIYDEGHIGAVDAMAEHCLDLKVLGSYSSGS